MGESTCYYLLGGSQWRVETAVWCGSCHDASFVCVCFLCFWPDNWPTRAGAALRAAPSERGWAIMWHRKVPVLRFISVFELPMVSLTEQTHHCHCPLSDVGVDQSRRCVRRASPEDKLIKHQASQSPRPHWPRRTAAADPARPSPPAQLHLASTQF